MATSVDKRLDALEAAAKPKGDQVIFVYYSHPDGRLEIPSGDGRYDTPVSRETLDRMIADCGPDALVIHVEYVDMNGREADGSGNSWRHPWWIDG